MKLEHDVTDDEEQREQLTIQTVTGPIAVGDLGTTLTHEHVIGDFEAWWDRETTSPLAHRPLEMSAIGRLRHDPFCNRDNTLLTDEATAVAELQRYRAAGGRSLMDPTCIGIGRDVAAQRRVSEASGVHIVAGSGWYIRDARPPGTAELSIEQLEAAIVRDVTEGVDDTGIRSGFIGEIGITDGSERVSAEDERILRAAARAHVRTGVPLMIHLIDPLGDDVLDIAESEGARLDATVLCHMGHTQDDFGYQARLAARGVRLGYDSFGIDWYFPGSDHQGRSDAQQLEGVLRLLEAGYARQLLLSSDVFLKMQLQQYGGFGYGHVIENILPRLRRAGVSEDVVHALMVENPRALFVNAARLRA